MDRIISAGVPLILTAVAAFGQAAAPPAFDVASVKASARERQRGAFGQRERVQAEPGSLNMSNVSLKTAIAWAYGVMAYQVSGPQWLGIERFDILAKSAGPSPDSELRIMLQTLLAERFKLAVHRQTKELSAYVLVVGPNGPKFHESKTEGESALDADRQQLKVTIQRTPMGALVELLSNVSPLPVIDQTGLTGRYDITVNLAKYVMDVQSNEPMDPMTLIMRGLQEELGLKLESKKMALDLVIVDQAEKVPAEN